METIAMLISHKDIAYKPGGSPAQFKVTVINQSDRFASFQLDITPAGVEQNQDRLWYSISPEVSTKNPPGDAVEFTKKLGLKPRPLGRLYAILKQDARVVNLSKNLIA